MVVEGGLGQISERTHLLSPHAREVDAGADRHGDADTSSHINSIQSKDEQALWGTSISERLPYNDYTTVDWLHELVSSLYDNLATNSTNYIRSRILSGIEQFIAEEA